VTTIFVPVPHPVVASLSPFFRSFLLSSSFTSTGGLARTPVGWKEGGRGGRKEGGRGKKGSDLTRGNEDQSFPPAVGTGLSFQGREGGRDSRLFDCLWYVCITILDQWRHPQGAGEEEKAEEGKEENGRVRITMTRTGGRGK